MTPEQATKLRAPFRPEQIGKLPKAGIMLDYVGHAATTDRLLQVDPDWSWEPMAVGAYGEPLMTNGGMWIRLTVCGVTRPGFGDGKNPKEIIGDAIRNAAMRFGVALDLWAKEDLQPENSGGEPKPAQAGGSARREAVPPMDAAVSSPPDTPVPTDAADVVIHFGRNQGTRLGDLSEKQLQWYASREPNPQYESDEDRILKTAAQQLVAA